MATGRTTIQFVDFYADGYDLTGYGRTVGPLTWEFEEIDLTAGMGDAVKGYLLGDATLGVGTYNAVFDNTALVSSHVRLGSPGGYDTIMVPFGIRAAVAIGDPVYVGKFNQLAYGVVEEGKAVMINAVYGNTNPTTILDYSKPWGRMLHINEAETAVNGVITDTIDNAVQTLLGGYIVYQVFAAAGAGDMTATLKVEHSNTNVDLDFVDLPGATTGVIDCINPVAGIIQCATNETVERYTRWQIVLGTATSVTFALAFVRG